MRRNKPNSGLLAKETTPPESGVDWTPVQVLAALAETGQTLRGLDRQYGLTEGCAKHALRYSYPAAQKRIAKALGKEPQEIWPSRYKDKGDKKS